MSNIPSISASALIGTFGVNVHEGYNDTTYAPDGDTRATVAHLRKLGVKWIRIALKTKPPAYERAFLDQIHSSGIRVLGNTGQPHDNSGGFTIGESSQLVAALKGPVYGGRIDMIEMPNELDWTGGANWLTDLAQYGGEYYRALKENAVTSSIPVLGPSVGRASDYFALRESGGYQDYINLHPYTGRDVPESAQLGICGNGACAAFSRVASQHVIASELGWSTDLTFEQGVSEATASTYTGRVLIWNALHGVKISFLYELFDQGPDPSLTESELHYGLVRVSGTVGQPTTWLQSEKPAFNVVERLVKYLSVHEQGVVRPPIAVRVSTSSSDVVAYRITHPGGAVDVAYWSKTTASSSVSDPVTISTYENVEADSYTLATGSHHRLAAVSGTLRLISTPQVQIVRLIRR